MIMQKIGKNSHFEIINGSNLYKYQNRIIQIATDQLYENKDGYSVHICEVDDSPGVVAEYNRGIKK